MRYVVKANDGTFVTSIIDECIDFDNNEEFLVIDEPLPDTFIKPKLVNNQWVETFNIDSEKPKYIEICESVVENWRSQFVSNKVLQQPVYLRKIEEYYKVVSDQNVAGTSETPRLNAQVVRMKSHEIDGKKPGEEGGKEISQGVLDECTKIGNIINQVLAYEDGSEAARLNCKELISDAENINELKQAIESLNSELASLLE